MSEASAPSALSLEELSEHVKQTALESGVLKVGIASRADLEGPPEANLDNVLQDATHAVSLAVAEPEDHILEYLGKTDPTPYREHFYRNIQTIGRAGIIVAECLNELGYRASSPTPAPSERPLARAP